MKLNDIKEHLGEVMECLPELPAESMVSLEYAHQACQRDFKNLSEGKEVAETLLNKGFPLDAWTVFEKVIENKPSHELTSADLVLGINFSQRAYRLISLYEFYLALQQKEEPIHETVQRKKIRADIQLGVVSQARSALENLTSQNWNHPEWHALWGDYFLDQEAYEWCSSAYLTSLKHDKQFLDALKGIALLHTHLGEWQTLDHYLNRIENEHGKIPFISYINGRRLLSHNSLPYRAEESFLKAIEQAPYTPEYWLWLGHSRHASGALPSALYAYQHAFWIAPEFLVTRYFLARALHVNGQTETATKIVSQLRAERPNSEPIKTLEKELQPAPAPAPAVESITPFSRKESHSEMPQELPDASQDNESVHSVNVSMESPFHQLLSEPHQTKTSHLAEQAAQEPSDHPSPQGSPSVHSESPKQPRLNTYMNFDPDDIEGSLKERDEHLEMASQQMPGPNYLRMLQCIHRWLKPANYMEIGVEHGNSLAYALEHTQCIGIDPDPKIKAKFTAPTQIFRKTSDDFFEKHSAQELLGNPLEFVFIDGLHVFEQVLKDFINVEKNSSPRTVVLLHDCYPINEITQRADRATLFWSGDPWKLIPCLKNERPDLSVHTIKTHPTGLGIIMGCDPKNEHLDKNYEDLASTYKNCKYEDIESNKDEQLNAIPNDWEYVRKLVETHIEKVSKPMTAG